MKPRVCLAKRCPQKMRSATQHCNPFPKSNSLDLQHRDPRCEAARPATQNAPHPTLQTHHACQRQTLVPATYLCKRRPLAGACYTKSWPNMNRIAISNVFNTFDLKSFNHEGDTFRELNCQKMCGRCVHTWTVSLWIFMSSFLLSNLSFFLSFFLSIHLSTIRLSIHPPIHPCIHPSIHPFFTHASGLLGTQLPI